VTIAARVREATRADAANIASVHVWSWRRAYRHVFPTSELDAISIDDRARRWDEWLARAEERRATYVVEEDGRIVGFANIGPCRDEDARGLGEVHAIYVLAERWGVGLGRALMAAAVDGLVAAGFDSAVLWVLEDNVRARGFYEAAGWQPDGGVRRGRHLGVETAELRYRIALGR
jgi:L-amino acid N-acyltransferase YncA